MEGLSHYKDITDLFWDSIKEAPVEDISYENIIGGLAINNNTVWLGFAGPLILAVIATVKKKNSHIYFHARQALIFQTVGLIVLFFLWLLWGVLSNIAFSSVPEIQKISVSKVIVMFIALIPAAFALFLVVYEALIAGDLERVSHSNGSVKYYWLSDWLEKRYDNENMKRLEADKEAQAHYLQKRADDLVLGLKAYQGGIQFYNRAIPLYAEIGKTTNQITCLIRILYCREKLDQDKEKLPVLIDLASLSRARGDKTLLYASTQNIEKIASKLALAGTAGSDIAENQSLYKILFDGCLDYCYKNYEIAAKCFSQICQEDPHNAHFWTNLGNTLFYLKRTEESISAYDSAIECEPDWGFLYRNRARALLIDNKEKARNDIKRAYEIEPRHPYSRALLGYDELFQDHYENAVRYFQIAIGQESKTEWKIGLALAKICLAHSGDAEQIIGALNSEDSEIARAELLWLELASANDPNLKLAVQNVAEMIQKALFETK